MKIRLTQIDGKLPNLALMKLAHWYRARGDDVYLTRRVTRDFFETDYDRVYGSAIFSFCEARQARFLTQWPGALLAGTGTLNTATVEAEIGGEYEHYDYADYPDFAFSMGFSARGCRMKCKFCVVPQKEGKPRSVNTISDIWRGGDAPRKIVLLDNDFFGQEEWQARIAELQDGNFRVSLNQGINIRLINDEAAEALASIEYRDGNFTARRLYTAWDNLKDEKVFFRGVERLERAGVPPHHLMVYMLIGFDPKETWERILHRFDRMVEMGIMPYPMVYNNERKDLKVFQRWVVRGLYRYIPWDDYLGSVSRKSLDARQDTRQGDMLVDAR